MKAWIGGLGAAVLLAWTGAAAAQAQSPAAELVDRYFGFPNAPETFRALAGQGDPRIEAEGVYDSYGYISNTAPDIALIKPLFPGAESEWGGISSGSCRTAQPVAVLKARIARLGKDHPYVRRWQEAQRAVFEACRHDDRPKGPAPALPPALAIQDPGLAELQAADRAYQAASLSFYLGDRPAAAAAFQRIARSASPHRLMARYMAAAIRAGSPPRRYGAEKPLVPIDQAIAEVKAILADPDAKPIHPMAQQLIGWIGASIADEPTRRAQVELTLAALEVPTDQLARDPEARRRYALARADLDRLHAWSSPPGWWLGEGPPAEFTASRVMMQKAGTDPLVAWVLFPRSYVHGTPWAPFHRDAVIPNGWTALRDYADAQSGGHGAGFAWTRAKRAISTEYDATIWTEVRAEEGPAARSDQKAAAALAFDFYHQVRTALMAAPNYEGMREEAFGVALAAMQAFPLKDAGLWGAARHDALQYLMSVGRLAEARRWRDGLYPPAPDPWRSDAALLQILAEDEAHFAAALASDAGPLELQDNLAVAALRRLAARADTPPKLRARFSRIAWGRTYALGRTVDGDLDRLMRGLNPELTKGWTSTAGRPVKPDDRRALLDVLRSPGVNILIVDTDREAGSPNGDEDPGMTGIDLWNHDDDNWWCRWKTGRHERADEQMLRYAFFEEADLELAGGEAAYGLRMGLTPLLRSSWAYRQRDAAETAALAAIPCAPKVLSERAIAWVRHPGWFGRRDGQAEALALAVKSTRYGCYSDGPHGAYSKDAWTLLHQRFGETEWARKTKYWFNCPLGGTECPAVGEE